MTQLQHKARSTVVNNSLRWFKHYALSSGTQYRRIRFGVAAGSVLPIDRQNDFRVEFGLVEMTLNRYVRAFGRRAKVVYDIGSAHGYYSLAFCRLMAPTGRVYAFEAEDRYIEELRQTALKNGLSQRIEVIPGFVGDVDSGNTHSIDKLVEQKIIELPDLLKIDVEGAELKVFHGMEKTLRASSPDVILEVHALDLERECIRLLFGLGYRVKILDQGWLNNILPEYRPLEHNRWVVATKRFKQ